MGGISQLVGTLAMLGFLAFLAGVGLVVVSASQGRSVRGGVVLAAIGLVAGVILLVVSQGIIVVAPQEVAVVFETISGDLGEPRGPGTHIIIPILQEATIYPTERQEYTMSSIINEGNVQGNDSVTARTSDGQSVLLDITVIYRINPLEVNRIHQNWQRRYEADYIRPVSRGLVREVTSNFTAERIYGEGRDDLRQQMSDSIGAALAAEGLELIDLQLREITFSDDFTAAIEQASVALQQVERERRLIQQNEAVAEQQVATARGERDSAITRAEGDAQSIILNARARAEALRLVSEQIAANPLLIQYEYIQNMGNVNLALVPSNSPFLFDFNSIADMPTGNSDFTAPEVPDSSDIDITDPTQGTTDTGTGN